MPKLFSLLQKDKKKKEKRLSLPTTVAASVKKQRDENGRLFCPGKVRVHFSSCRSVQSTVFHSSQSLEAARENREWIGVFKCVFWELSLLQKCDFSSPKCLPVTRHWIG